MPLTPGTRLGPYEIVAPLGAGGMGEVFRATDTRLGREVAVKVLPHHLSDNPEVRARFEREAKTVSSLNHPHICTLHDVGREGDTDYLVMELVEGETLAQRLEKGPLPVADVLRLGGQIADALDRAHRAGVVHRDLKPGNVMLTRSGAKLMDFGLARATGMAGPAGGSGVTVAALAHSPTVAQPLTAEGTIVGTFQYMSPEQLEGGEADARSDLWALGCVLYEMATGKRAFEGRSQASLIGSIMHREPPAVSQVAPLSPPGLDRLVQACLAKDPGDRLQSAHDIRMQLAWLAEGGSQAGVPAPVAAARRGRAGLATMLAAAGWLVAIAAVAWIALRGLRTGEDPRGMVGRYEVVLGGAAPISYFGNSEPSRLALTPDGRELVYTGGADGGPMQLFVRPLDSFVARPIPGTTGALTPKVSWDGARVAYLTMSPFTMRVASLRGGAPLTLLDSAFTSAPEWGPNGFVYFLRDLTIRRIPGGGGPVEDVVTLPAPAAGGRYARLKVLPGGHAALVTEVPPSGDRVTLLAVDLKSGRSGARLEGLSGHYVAEARALVYVTQDGTLMAVGFDLGGLATRGRPVPLFDGVSVRRSQSDLTVGSGTLAYVLPGTNAPERICWVNRPGAVMAPVDSGWHDSEFEAFALSPDGSRLAITIMSKGQSTNRTDVWIKQLDRGPLSRLTFNGQSNGAPSWSGDGRWVSYISRRDNRWSLWRRQADGAGAEERVADIGRNFREARWSRDGAWLVASVSGASDDILVKHMGADSTLRPLLAEAGYDEFEPSLSPDGRWLAYASNETGTEQVFVRPFPDVQQGKWQISTDGGLDPVWSRDGRELFFRRASDGQVLEVADMAQGPALAVRRVVLRAPAGTEFEANERDRMLEVSPDGRRFLVSATMGGDHSGNLVIVQNFITELKAALAGGARR